MQWDPNTGKWEPLPGVEQGGLPTQPRRVITEDMGGHVNLWDESTGQYLGSAPKTLGPDQMEPKVIGSSTGPEITIYNPRDNTVTTIPNRAYERKPQQVTTNQSDRYIVRQDPVTGELKAEANVNYNPYGKDNRIEGKGLAEGKISFVDAEGNVRTVDTLSPEERQGTQAGAEAENTKKIAEAEKLKVEADIAKKEQEAWDLVQQAIDEGASPAQVRGLVERGVRSVQDYAALRNAETSRQTQVEAARHNLAGEQEGMRTRRTAEAGEARAGAESYGRYGMASAPFQTALLGSLSQVADPRAVGARMRIDQGVIDPVANVFDQRQQEVKATQARQDEMVERAKEPPTERWRPAGQQPAGGTEAVPAGSATPPGPQGTPRQRVPGQQYTGNPVADQARQAVDLGNGKARTYYDDNTYDDWDIPQRPQQQAAPQAEAPALEPQPEPQASPYAEPEQPFGPNEGYGLGGGAPSAMGQRFPPAGGGAQTPPSRTPGESGQPSTRRPRLPAEGKRAVWLGNGWARTEYDDGAVEQWHVEDGPSWDGVGGGGAGFWGEDPPTMGAYGWEKGTVGGGGSLWTVPPPPSVSTAYGASTALAQGQQNVRPQEKPAGTAGGFAGPAPQQNAQGGGGQYGQAMAPMWDDGLPRAVRHQRGRRGVRGRRAEHPLRAGRHAPRPDPHGAGLRGRLGRGRPSDAGRATLPPKTSGSYYGGPGLPQAMSPLQRLLQQSGVIPLHAGRAAGSPGTV